MLKTFILILHFLSLSREDCNFFSKKISILLGTNCFYCDPITESDCIICNPCTFFS